MFSSTIHAPPLPPPPNPPLKQGLHYIINVVCLNFFVFVFSFFLVFCMLDIISHPSQLHHTLLLLHHDELGYQVEKAQWKRCKKVTHDML